MLRARGRRVGPLLLVASTAGNAPFVRLRHAVRAIARLLRWTPGREFRCYWSVRGRALAWARLHGAAPGAHRAFLLAELRAAVRRCRDALAPTPFTVGSTAFARMAEVLAHYFPGRYDGPVHHFWGCSDVPSLPGDATMGWGAVASRLELHRVPGDHFTLVTQETEPLAAAARPLLAYFD